MKRVLLGRKGLNKQGGSVWIGRVRGSSACHWGMFLEGTFPNGMQKMFPKGAECQRLLNNINIILHCSYPYFYEQVFIYLFVFILIIFYF